MDGWMNSLGILRVSVIHSAFFSSFFSFPSSLSLAPCCFSAALTYMLPATLPQHILSLRTIPRPYPSPHANSMHALQQDLPALDEHRRPHLHPVWCLLYVAPSSHAHSSPITHARQCANYTRHLFNKKKNHPFSEED